MEKIILRVLFLALCILSACIVSCSNKDKKIELKFTPEDVLNIAHETTFSKERGDLVIKLSEYSPGINRLEVMSLTYKRLSFFVVPFENSAQACGEAVRLNQYCARNLLFDRVEGEPILEDYIIVKFKAINPTRRVQRKPKNLEEESHGAHGEVHGETHGAPAAHH